MRPVTVALLVAGVAGAGAAVYFFVIKPRMQAAAAVQLATAPPAAAPKVSTTQAIVSTVVTGSHVDRKNALAPEIISRVTGGIVPSGTASRISNIAGKLSLSSYAQNYVSTKIPIVGKIAEAPVSIVKSLAGGIASLF